MNTTMWDGKEEGWTLVEQRKVRKPKKSNAPVAKD